MFTKTGLRPREVQSLDARSGIGKKLPPVTATDQCDFFYAGISGGVTAMSSIRRKKAGGRSTSSSSSTRGRREVHRHGGGNRGRSQSAGRKREVSNAVRAQRLTRKRPEWDDSLRDTSQYRLTAEEALRRKMSLVSKHNTLVFGLGGGSTSKTAAAALPSSARATAAAETTATATEVARWRFSKQQQQQQSRKARGGGASAVSSGSSLSAIYGGGGGGGDSEGKVAVAHSAPAPTEADLTAATSEEGSGPACAGGINDATMSLYTKHGGGGGANPGEHQDGDDCRSDGGSGRGGSSHDGNGGDVVESPLLGGGRSASGADAGGASSLADLELGIKAFSERVGRLETFGKAGLLEESTARRRRSSAESESESESEDQDKDRNETDCRSHQSGDVSPGHAAVLDGSVSDDALSRGPQRDNSRGRQLSTATEHGGGDGSEVHHRDHGRPANPWSYGSPASKPYFREQRLRRAAAGAQPSSTSDGGGGGGEEEEISLVKRIELLEAQVIGMCSASAPVVADGNASSTAEGPNQDQEASPCKNTAAVPAPSPGRERTAREEQLRGVVVDLLSLSGALLKRATSAERRLHELGRGRGPLGGIDSVIVANSGDALERARRVRAFAEATVVPASGDDDGEFVPASTAAQHGARTAPPAAASTSGSIGTATAGAPSLPEEAASLPSGGKARRVSPSPPRPRRRTTTPRSATTDCWGEALDGVGRLVDSQPSGSGFGLDETDDDEPPFSVPSFPPEQQSPSCLGLPPTPKGNKRVPAAAAAAATAVVVPASPISGFAETGSLPGRIVLPPPPPRSAGSDNIGGVTRGYQWKAAPQDDTALFLLDAAGTTAALASNCGAGGTGRYAHISRPPWSARKRLGWPVRGEGDGEEEEEEEEDARASPAFWAPNPSKKPQHPFRGQQGAPMRSPTEPRRHMGQQVKGEPGSESEPRGGFFPSSCPEGRLGIGHGGGSSGVRELRGGGDDRRDSVDEAPRPPIGQWYTPPSPIVEG